MKGLKKGQKIRELHIQAKEGESVTCFNVAYDTPIDAQIERIRELLEDGQVLRIWIAMD